MSKAKDNLTVDRLFDVVSLLRDYSVPPGVVKTKKEADELTKTDSFGRKWRVGDQYYVGETKPSTILVQLQEV